MLSSLFVLGMVCFGLSGCGSTEPPEQGLVAPGLPGGGESISMDPPEEPDPVGSSWVPPTPDGEEQEENSRLYTPLTLRAEDAGNEGDVLLHWSVESANQQAFLIERQQWWGEVWTNDELIVAPPYPYTYRDDPGAGVWRYRVAAANEDGASDPTDWAEVTVASSWTTFTPSADTRIVYVSSSEGNDSNDGLSPYSPKATIAAGYALLRNGYPDWLLLKRGDVWEESLGHWKKSGRSATEMMVVNTYGDAVARPLLRTGTGNGFFRSPPPNTSNRIDYIAVVGIHFIPHTRTTESCFGFRWLGDGSDLLIEDCRFERYKDNLAIEGGDGVVDRVRIRRCIIVDSYAVGSHSQGLYPSLVNNLVLEECLFDHNGWSEAVDGAGQTIYSRNIYIARSCGPVAIRNCILARSGSEGVQMRSGGLCENSLLLQNSTGLLFGQFQSAWPEGAASGVVRHNVVLDARNIADLPRGFGIQLQQVDGVELYGNIVAHQRSGTGNVYAFALEYNCHNVTIDRNIAFDWAHPDNANSYSLHMNATFGGEIRITNNSFQQPFAGKLLRHSVAYDPTITRYSGNKYFSPATTTPFYIVGAGSLTYDQWLDTTSEANASYAATVFPDPTRDIASYMQSIGYDPSLEAFLAEAREQSRMNWRSEFTAPVVNNYIRGGFGMQDR